jgi:hypothetical protein
VIVVKAIDCTRCGHAVGCAYCEHTREMVRLSRSCDRCADETVIAEAARLGLMNQPVEVKRQEFRQKAEVPRQLKRRRTSLTDEQSSLARRAMTYSSLYQAEKNLGHPRSSFQRWISKLPDEDALADEDASA